MSKSQQKSNIATGIAVKGSKLMMQLMVNGCTDAIERKLQVGKIEWISPLKDDEYKEYRLESKKIQDKLGINREDIQFWPKNGPQWDGIALAEDKTILLFEAKAHIKEVKSSCSSKSTDSKEMINSAIKEVFSELEPWYSEYYQIANRYVFLKKLLDKGYSVKLVFIYFANDSFGKTSQEDWRRNNKAIEDKIKKELIDKTIESNVIRVIVDVSMEFRIG